METEIVGSNADLMARHKQISGKRGKRRSCTQRATENKLEDSSVESIATRRRVCGRGRNMASDTLRAMENELVVTNGDLIARTVGGRGKHERGGHRQGGRGGRQGTRRGMQGTWSHPTQKRVRKTEQNMEISNLGLNMKSGSPSAEIVRSCKKNIWSWMMDCKIIKENDQVWYKDGTWKTAITGRITRGGILCSCCQEETSVWTFEKHSGSDLRQPYNYIYATNLKKRKRECLKECLKFAWQCKGLHYRQFKFLYMPKETSADQNDDACSVCGDGGDLICCDKCPSTYHLFCMNMERVPQNKWFCPYCVCKYCGLVVEEKEGFKCSPCVKKCHWECIEKETLDLNPSRSYCGPGCREIHEKLEVSLGIRNDFSAKYSWSVIRRLDETSQGASQEVYESEIVLSNSKVAVTWMLMNEAFETITDRYTGINVIQSIVYSYGAILTRIDFSRFYMFVLEKDDEIIAAASVRFHGKGIAEMPFIATEMTYRGQGVCQDLMRVIESFLCDLEIKNLIIPSALETAEMWKRKFNFTEVTEELEREISSYNILMFPCALRLCKDLSASIADNQTDIKNDLGPQMEQAEATAILENWK